MDMDMKQSRDQTLSKMGYTLAPTTSQAWIPLWNRLQLKAR